MEKPKKRNESQMCLTLWVTPSMTVTTKVVTVAWTPMKPRISRHSLAKPRTIEVSFRTVVEVETTIGISLLISIPLAMQLAP